MWFKGENEDPIYSLDLRNVQVRFIQVYCDYKDQNWLCTLDEIYFHEIHQDEINLDEIHHDEITFD